MPAFHEIRFPTDIAIRSRGGPQRRTDIVTLGSGREERNQRWAHARRRFDAGYGVRSLAALSAVVAFFEERRGRLHGFRFRDRLDDRSCPPGQTPTMLDQPLGIGAGGAAAQSFQLMKVYGQGIDPYERPIRKPVSGSVLVAVDGTARTPGTHFTLDAATGLVTFPAGQAPAVGAAITAGFLFDVPVRFDTDELDVDLSSFEAGAIPSIPLIEIVV
jgi:uncharacterized protein (TIGR02217 family)